MGIEVHLCPPLLEHEGMSREAAQMRTCECGRTGSLDHWGKLGRKCSERRGSYLPYESLIAWTTDVP